MRTLRSPYSVTRAGLHLEILPGTFAPYLDSEVLANTIQLNRAETLLDVGTGSGLVAVAAARQGNRVVATDLNPSAVRCARHNMARLGLDELATVYEADLVPPAEAGRFNVISFNPPYTDHPATDHAERSVWDPGHLIVRRFFDQVRHHLLPNGRLHISWADFADFDFIERLIGTSGGQYGRISDVRDAVAQYTVYQVYFDRD
jgi:release factor glutamine methyltransferase